MPSLPWLVSAASEQSWLAFETAFSSLHPFGSAHQRTQKCTAAIPFLCVLQHMEEDRDKTPEK